MDVWPAQLQQRVNVNSFGVELGDTLLRSQMDIGPDKVRSRFTSGVDKYTWSVNLDYDDYSVLTVFFKTTLSNGALPFELEDPMTGITAAFRFTKPPSIRPLGGRTFTVEAQLEKLP